MAMTELLSFLPGNMIIIASLRIYSESSFSFRRSVITVDINSKKKAF